MSIVQQINSFLQFLGFSSSLAGQLDGLFAFLGVLLIAYLADAICRKVLLRVISHLVRQTKATWDDIVFDRRVMVHLSRLVAPIIIYVLLPLAFSGANIETLLLVRRFCLIFVIIMFLSFINTFLSAVYAVYSVKEQFRDRPMKGLLQTVQVIIYFIGGIIVVSILIDQSPMVLLTGLGASAAVLMLVFKDSIMGFVSGIQLSANKMLKVGDWITMPKYGADGDVIEVSLNTVKVRNFDKTITTIPPYALVSDSFQNWSGMEESGGRRIKRSISIDMDSVKFCSPEMLAKYRKIQLLTGYVEQTEQVIEAYNKEHHIDNSVLVNGRRQTNLGVFRAYLTYYLKNHSGVNHGMTCMVRQLQPTNQGLPLELYFFAATTSWVPYEDLQSDVFDHLLAIISEFDLQVFQSLTGRMKV